MFIFPVGRLPGMGEDLQIIIKKGKPMEEIGGKEREG